MPQWLGPFFEQKRCRAKGCRSAVERRSELAAVVAVPLLTFVGCFAAEEPAPQPVVWKTSPELVELFGGEENLDEARHAYTSSQLSKIHRPTGRNVGGPIMYAHDRVADLTELLGTADSYDWSRPTDGEFFADIEIDLVGKRFFEQVNAGREAKRTNVYLDLVRQLVEVRIAGEPNRRASMAPMADRMRAYLTGDLGLSYPTPQPESRSSSPTGAPSGL